MAMDDMKNSLLAVNESNQPSGTIGERFLRQCLYHTDFSHFSFVFGGVKARLPARLEYIMAG